MQSILEDWRTPFHWQIAGIATVKIHVYLLAEREQERKREPGWQNAIDYNNEYKNTNNFYVYYFEVIVSIVLVRSCSRYEK